jgi:hypothetical protein
MTQSYDAEAFAQFIHDILHEVYGKGGKEAREALLSTGAPSVESAVACAIAQALNERYFITERAFGN